ncbi:hypothetical protein RGQ29_022631 [Quercus rubra]|uniref:peptidylprolyl isomerase n=1 Tax=Quercus rubra TaxID=3512 RepID=A0AAN7ISQ4_QUERU|nr:hypothetical protein RGQ29_022631 [Quercus rubra]
MKPQLHYGEDDCPVSVAYDFPNDDELHFEIEMIDFFKAKDVCDDLGVVKKVINEGLGWESPREPYEVTAWISAETGDGKLILSYMEGEPYFFTFGKSEVPKSLEMGIGMMPRGEKAVVYVTSQYLTQSPLIPVMEGLEEVHFEVQLVHFIQDWTGLKFRSIMDEAEKIRLTGNRLFKEGKFKLAKAKYEKNLLHLDVAACQLKLGECRNSIDTCNKMQTLHM